MSDLGLLVSFVKTVIRPKAKAIGLLNTEIDSLGAKIVRAWLATVISWSWAGKVNWGQICKPET